MKPGAPCPCGSGRGYAVCCGPYLERAAQPATAEQLMRSRYTAYALARADYLLRTWHASTRPARLDLDGEIKWLGLKVVRSAGGSAHDHEGFVEFVARYKPHGPAGRLHETSRFVKEDGRWYYVDGAVAEAQAATRRCRD